MLRYTQFEDFRIFLSLRFYVKSILANLEKFKKNGFTENVSSYISVENTDTFPS